MSGTLYVFFPRRADRFRTLYWDRDGYVLMMKRFENSTYRLSWATQRGRISVEATEVLLIPEMIELHQRRSY